MFGLIKKDFFVTIKRFQKIQLLIMTVAMVPITQFPQMALIVLGMMLAYLSVILVSMSFVYDENAKWNEYTIVLPIDCRKIVLSKFLLADIYMVMAMVLIFILYAVGSTFSIFTWQNLLEILVFIAVFCSIYNALQIPITYHFGAEIGRYAFLIMLLLFYGIIMLGVYLHIDIREMNFNIQAAELIIILLLLLLLNYISFVISERIYREKRKK